MKWVKIQPQQRVRRSEITGVDLIEALPERVDIDVKTKDELHRLSFYDREDATEFLIDEIGLSFAQVRNMFDYGILLLRDKDFENAMELVLSMEFSIEDDACTSIETIAHVFKTYWPRKVDDEGLQQNLHRFFKNDERFAISSFGPRETLVIKGLFHVGSLME